MPVGLAIDDEFVCRGLDPVHGRLASRGSAIMVRISGGSRLLVKIVEVLRWRSTISS